MLSYMSLLVLVLATSAVSPVQAPDPLEVEGTSHSEPSERPRFKITTGKVVAGLGTLALMAIIVGNLAGGPHSHPNNNDPTNTTQPTTTTQPTPTTQPTAPPSTWPPKPAPTTPPRAFSERETYLNGVADSVVTTVGHSEARSISDNYNQTTHTSSLDLLDRAHLGETFKLFSRMLDELD